MSEIGYVKAFVMVVLKETITRLEAQADRAQAAGEKQNLAQIEQEIAHYQTKLTKLAASPAEVVRRRR